MQLFLFALVSSHTVQDLISIHNQLRIYSLQVLQCISNTLRNLVLNKVITILLHYSQVSKQSQAFIYNQLYHAIITSLHHSNHDFSLFAGLSRSHPSHISTSKQSCSKPNHPTYPYPITLYQKSKRSFLTSKEQTQRNSVSGCFPHSRGSFPQGGSTHLKTRPGCTSKSHQSH
jgi:hypothetical protein